MNHDPDNDAMGDFPGQHAGESLRRAWVWAGAKVAIGFLMLCAVIGIRIVSIGSSDSSEGTDPMAKKMAKAATESEVRKDESRSVLARLSERAKDDSPGNSGSDAGSRFVSCDFPNGAQFMTAADCAVRGGQATKTFEDQSNESKPASWP